MRRGLDLERVVEIALTAGLVLSAALWLAGLVLGRDALLHAGMVTLLLTPIARLVVTTVGYVRTREWPFALVSLWILLLLGSSVAVAARRSAPPVPDRRDKVVRPSGSAARGALVPARRTAACRRGGTLNPEESLEPNRGHPTPPSSA